MLPDRLLGWLRPACRCAVVTPVGPGHRDLYRECEASVRDAWRGNRGPFTHLELIAIDDQEGRLGRSHARNEGVRLARAAGAHWIFFLDADDLMLPGAFGEVAHRIEQYDAIWGLITSRSMDAVEHHLRLPQILNIDRIEQVIVFDPFLTLQMGHFVRVEAALATPFDEQLDAGEDFDYYLRLWRDFRCVKIPASLSVARQGRRSGGPRGATPEAWGNAVRTRLAAERTRFALGADEPQTLTLKNAAVADLQAFYRARGLADAQNYAQLARDMPYRGWHSIGEFDGRPFMMYSDNDDPVCLSLAWTGEYHFLAARIWQRLARDAGTILDAAAGTGFYTLLAERAARTGAAIYCFEPDAVTQRRLKLNLDASEAGVEILGNALDAGDRSTAPAWRHAASVAELLRIDGAHAGADAAIGCALSGQRPDFLFVTPACGASIAEKNLLAAAEYRFYALDDAASRVVPADPRNGTTYHWWATRRAVSEVAAIVRDAGGTLQETVSP